MRSENVTLYYADDGTPFKDNKLACETYEKICHRTKQLIMSGKLKFWGTLDTSTGKCKYLLNELLDFGFNPKEKLCYLDWLRQQLKQVRFFAICLKNYKEAVDELDECWEFLKNYLKIDDCDIRIIKTHYQNCDVCQYVEENCAWTNLDGNIRSAETLRNMLE